MIDDRQMTSPDAMFVWSGSAAGARMVHLSFDGMSSITADDLASLADGAAHAHDDDVLEAIIRNFAEHHGLDVVTFLASPAAGLVVDLRVRPT